MGFWKDLSTNIGILSKQALPGSPVGNQEVGLAQLNYSGAQDPNDRQAIFPAWFFSQRLGQPRQVDTQKIRKLAQSPWAFMVLSTFKKQIYTTEWKITKTDEDEEGDRSEDIKKITDFLNNINPNGQTINDLNSESVTDIGEIDAGVWNYVYTSDSYTIGDLPLYDAWGKVIGTEVGLVLKPLGQREIVQVKSVDGASMLKQVDIHKNLLNFWQYSFKHPRQNPTRFEKEEISYMIMNSKSYSIYGFSPMQSVQQVIELLIQGTRYNKDLYTNNAIPDVLVSLPKLPGPGLKKLKREWNRSYKGKPHQVGFINWAIENFHKLTDSNRDLEWLDGQKWYKKLVFGVYGVSPTEAGFFENSNKSNDDGQERVTVRNAVKPYLALFEHVITSRLITEILQREDHGLQFEYMPKDHTLEKIEFEQDMQELDHGTLTINEFRRKKGREKAEWGDDPLRRPFDPATSFTNFGGPMPGAPSNSNNPNEPKGPKSPDPNKMFRKKFEAFLNDSK